MIPVTSAALVVILLMLWAGIRVANSMMVGSLVLDVAVAVGLACAAVAQAPAHAVWVMAGGFVMMWIDGRGGDA